MGRMTGAAAAGALGTLETLDALRRRIADVVDGDPADGAGVLSTGIAALDAVLRGGVPRGRLTELVGEPGTGKTSIVRRLVAESLAGGVWVAYVDAARTLDARDWAALAEGRAPLWVVRPTDAARGAWCADVLLRSGAFGLVVVDGAPTLTRSVALRLLQLARDADAALVLLGDGARASDVGGALRLRTARLRAERRASLRMLPGAPNGPHAPNGPNAPDVLPAVGRHRVGATDTAGADARRLTVTVEKGGTHRTLEVSCAIDVARRLCAHPEVPDRRDVAGAAPRGAAGEPGGAAARPAAGPFRDARIAAHGDARDGARDGARDAVARPVPLRRARRCAEPELGRWHAVRHP
jgi:recombination protein RecA